MSSFWLFPATLCTAFVVIQQHGLSVCLDEQGLDCSCEGSYGGGKEPGRMQTAYQSQQ